MVALTVVFSHPSGLETVGAMQIVSNPVLVNTLRGDIVDMRHRGAVAVCDPRGRVVMSHGDVEALSYPRSSIKALQAIPLVESGAADHFGLSDAELALACSSHSAELSHTQTVEAWLTRIGLDEHALECGAHEPMHAGTAESMIANGMVPSRLHNNCSGKHAGMLTTTRFLNEDTQGYIDREHPAQQRWLETVGELVDLDLLQLPWSYDGCGIPVVAMPLASVAKAFARFAAPDDLPQQRAESISRIAGSIAAQPFMVAGTGRLCTELMQVTGRAVMAKTGADGYFAASLPEQGLGIAIKIDDGSREATEVALLATLRHMNALTNDQLDVLAERIRIPVVNTLGVVAGYREPASVWQMHA